MDQAHRPALGIRISPEAASLASSQHTVWMLINLLARSAGIVESIRLECDPTVATRGRIVPLAPGVEPFAEALAVGAAAVGGVRLDLGVLDDRIDLTIQVGPGDPVIGGFRACGAGWWGWYLGWVHARPA